MNLEECSSSKNTMRQKDKHREGEDKETSAQSHPGVGQKKNKRLLTEDQLSSLFEILGRRRWGRWRGSKKRVASYFEFVILIQFINWLASLFWLSFYSDHYFDLNIINLYYFTFSILSSVVGFSFRSIGNKSLFSELRYQNFLFGLEGGKFNFRSDRDNFFSDYREWNAFVEKKRQS